MDNEFIDNKLKQIFNFMVNQKYLNQEFLCKFLFHTMGAIV